MSAVNYDWDFSKLPESEHQNVIDLFKSYQWAALLKIHNKHKLSTNRYCCSNVKDAMFKWFKYGIDTGQIKGTSEGETV
jgi:hypothetical protein